MKGGFQSSKTAWRAGKLMKLLSFKHLLLFMKKEENDEWPKEQRLETQRIIPPIVDTESRKISLFAQLYYRIYWR